MSEPIEGSLDQHFVSRVQMLSDVYANNISHADYVLSQRWLQRFHAASRRDKYARNCLMLLMYGQLREMGKLGKPFTSADSAHSKLEHVLCEYQGILGDAKQHEQHEPHKPSELGPVTEMEHPHDNAMAASAYNSGVSSKCFSATAPQMERSENGDPPTHYIHESDYERLTQQNHALIKEINVMHARTLENEQRYRQADSNWQRRMPHAQVAASRPRLLLTQIERGTMLAMRRLKEWTAASGPLNFLSYVLQDVLDNDDLESRRQLQELDHKLECLLDNMLEQVGERREKNVRMLYDQLFKQQQEALEAKQNLLRHEQRDLVQARQQLQAHVQDLKMREQLFWEQQADICVPGINKTPSLEEELQSDRNSANSNNSNNSNNSSNGKNSNNTGSCGCPDCQAEREQVSKSVASSPSPPPPPSPTRMQNSGRQRQLFEKRTCQYCEPGGLQQVEQLLHAALHDKFNSKS